MAFGVLLAAAMFGISAGLRCFTPIAALSIAIHLGAVSEVGFNGFLGTWIALVVFLLLAILELVGDKRPGTPNRTEIYALIGRIFAGAFAGYSLAYAVNVSEFVGAAVGGVFAVAGTYGGFYLRRYITKTIGVPDLPVALIEDAVATSLAAAAFVVAV